MHAQNIKSGFSISDKSQELIRIRGSSTGSPWGTLKAPEVVHHGPAQAFASRRPDFSLCFEESITRVDKTVNAATTQNPNNEQIFLLLRGKIELLTESVTANIQQSTSTVNHANLQLTRS